MERKKGLMVMDRKRTIRKRLGGVMGAVAFGALALGLIGSAPVEPDPNWGAEDTGAVVVEGPQVGDGAGGDLAPQGDTSWG